jgi:hypothetical protein
MSVYCEGVLMAKIVDFPVNGCYHDWLNEVSGLSQVRGNAKSVVSRRSNVASQHTSYSAWLLTNEVGTVGGWGISSDQ